MTHWILSPFKVARTIFNSSLITSLIIILFPSSITNLQKNEESFNTSTMLHNLLGFEYSTLKWDTPKYIIPQKHISLLPSRFSISHVEFTLFLWLGKLWDTIVLLSPFYNHTTIIFTLHSTSFMSNNLNLLCSKVFIFFFFSFLSKNTPTIFFSNNEERAYPTSNSLFDYLFF